MIGKLFYPMPKLCSYTQIGSMFFFFLGKCLPNLDSLV